MACSSSTALGPISPSRLAKLTCPARVAFDQLHTHGSGTTQPTGAALMGLVVHRAMELALGGLPIDDAWLSACADLAASGVDPRSLPGARRVERRVLRRFPELVDLCSALDSPEAVLEREFASADGELFGTPDLVLVEGQRATVIDYKSGFVTDDEGVSSQYEQQLQVYSGLVAEVLGKPVHRALLLSMKEGFVEVDVAPAAVLDALDRARAARRAFNDRAPGAQPGQPGPEQCRWCSHVVRCSSFWDAAERSWDAGLGGHAVAGTIEAIERSGAGTTAMKLRLDAGGTLSSDQATCVVAGVPTDLCGGADERDCARVTGLWARDDDTEVLRWGTNSRVAIEAASVK